MREVLKMSTEEKIFNAIESLNKFDYSLAEKLAHRASDKLEKKFKVSDIVSVEANAGIYSNLSLAYFIVTASDKRKFVGNIYQTWNGRYGSVSTTVRITQLKE